MAKLTARQNAAVLAAYDKVVGLLAHRGWLTDSQASTLTALAATV